MSAWTRLLLSVCFVSAVACDPPKLRGKGGPCHSLSDCKSGLACVEGKCSSDLEDVAGRVPRYEEPAPMTPGDAGAGDGGAVDAASPPTASPDSGSTDAEPDSGA